MSKDYYKTLDVDKGASQDEIKKAFRKKAHKYHPDKPTGDEARFKEINEANQVLGDEKKRSQYDQFGSDGPQGFGGGGGGGFGGMNINPDDLGDIFGGIGDMFGFGGGRQSTRTRKGRDIQVAMEIDFKDAVFGIDKEVSLRKNILCAHCDGSGAEPGSKIDTCQTCHGSGKVTKIQRTMLGDMQVQAPCDDCMGEGKIYSQKCKECHGSGVVNDVAKLSIHIPAGIDDGETIRATGQGEAGEKGAPSGNLFIKIRVKSDSKFNRVGYDIRTKAEISFTQAALGDKIDIETVDGNVKLKVPAGTQTSTIFKLKGKGVTRLQGRGRGDHLIEVIVMTPKTLTKGQKEALKNLEK